MTLFWVGLLISGGVIVLTFVWRGPVQPSTAPRATGVPGGSSQTIAAGLGLGAGGAAALPLSVALAYGLQADWVFPVLFFGLLGFAVLGLVGAAFSRGHHTSLAWMKVGLAGQALTLFGIIALAEAT